MNSRERILKALDHKEPDKIPIDLSSTIVSGIHINTYKEVMECLGFGYPKENKILEITQQLGVVDDRLLGRFQVDFKGVLPRPPKDWVMPEWDDDNNFYIKNEWGNISAKPKVKGYYYDYVHFPLNPFTEEIYNNFSFPDHLDQSRIQDISKEVKNIKDKEKKCVVFGINGYSVGLMQQLTYTIGFEEALINMKLNRKLIEKYLDELVKRDIEFYENLLDTEGKDLDIITYYDDFGAQDRLYISRNDFLSLFKNRYKKIFGAIHKKKEGIKIFFHSDGAIFEIIQDFIEMGVDILNPIQINAKGMNPKKIKKEFGKDLVFWGGLDTQYILQNGTIKEVENAVNELVNDLAPGGGFVFSSCHNILPNVPPKNVISAFDTIIKIRDY